MAPTLVRVFLTQLSVGRASGLPFCRFNGYVLKGVNK